MSAPWVNQEIVIEMAEVKEKRPVGRPTKYKPEYCEEVLKMAAEGMSMAEYAAAFGVDRPTLYDWKEQHVEFSTALTRAKALEQSWWEREARLNVKNREFNANLWYRCAAARFRDDYTERKETAVTGADGGAIKIEQTQKIDARQLDPSERQVLKKILLGEEGE